MGIAPEKSIATFIADPPEWLLTPATRIMVFVVVGLVVLIIWMRRSTTAVMTPLIEVAAMAYRRTQETGFAKVWEEHEPKDGLLLCYAGHIVKKGLAVGSKPPSTHLQPVHLKHSNTFPIQEGQLVIVDWPKTKVLWTNLHIPKAKVRKALAEMDRIMERPRFWQRLVSRR